MNEQDIWELIVKTVGEEQVKELETDLKSLNTTAAKMGEASDTAAKGTKNLGGAALEASRAMEDMQYGIAGVLNNIPSLVMQLGGPAGLAAAISLAAVGAKALYDHWDDIMGLFAEKQPFPAIAGDLHELDAALASNAKELDELREKHALTNDELARANVLIQQRTDLEAKQAAAKAIQRVRDTEAKSVKEAGDAIQKVIDQVGGPQAISDVQKAITAKYGDLGPDASRNMAEAIIANAIKGRSAAIDELTELMVGGFGGKSKTAIAMGAPAAAIAPLRGELTPEERRRIEKKKKETAEAEAKAAEEQQKAAAKAVDDELKTMLAETARETAAQKAETAKAHGVAAEFLPGFRKQLGEAPMIALAGGKSIESIQASIRAQAAAALKAGGVAPGGIPAAAAAMAETMGKTLRAAQGTGAVAQMRQREALAKQIYQQSRGLTGIQFSATASRKAADESLKMQAKGASTNEATLAAMGDALQAMRAILGKLNRQGAAAGRLQRGFKQVADHAQERQPAAANVGP